MTILMNDATTATISILQRTSELFGITQKRVASGKKVFTSADDTTRFAMSESILGRSRAISDVNNNISLGLATLEATDKSLKQIAGLVDSAVELARKALSEGSVGQRLTTTSALVNNSQVVTGVSIGSKFSITTDDGKNFTYTFASTTTTWGEVINALNASGIGVLGTFVSSASPPNTLLQFESIGNKDFRFDGLSDRNVMDDLTGMTTPTGQTFNPTNLFANGFAAPTAAETGFTIAYGGRVTGSAGGGVTPATPIAAGSTMTFKDGNGAYRSLSYGAATTLSQVITDITAMGAGIRAELVNQTGGAGGPLQLRLRNMNGGDMQIASATGDFAPAGSLGLSGVVTGFATPLAPNNALRLAYGQQYDAIIQNIDLLVANNPVPVGRNLLRGENISVIMDEFAGTPIAISGVLVTAASTLTMAQSGASWVNELNISTSSGQAKQAQVVVRQLMAQFAAFTSYIKSRYDLNKAFQSETKTQGDDLVAADTSEESASLVALQTRQQFAVEAMSISNQNAQSLLRLLG
jgi:flagellin-like hook-associated protein FlgL